MNEETGITVVAAIGIAAVAILAILLISNLQKQRRIRNRDQRQNPNSFE